MKDIFELSASAMKRPWFYLGSACLAADAVVRFLKPPADPSGGPAVIGLAFTFFFALAYICFVLIQIRELRDQHVVTIPNRNSWNMGCSLAWFHIKITLLTILPLGIPIIYLAITAKNTNGFSPLLILATLAIFLLAMFFTLLYVVGSALVIVRGHAQKSVRGSFEAMRHIWLETILLTVFIGILGVISSSGMILGSFSPNLMVFGTGLEVLLAPIVYLSRAVGIVYLAKLLRARALDFVRQSPAEVGVQSSSSEA
jgi:hypothetical protein